ncbi:polymer-forming cytoskeletal protein [Rhodobacteraceae bacterium DSL-40]|uniref:bactofilin family protein n=1 Tax=Amaricoccus sp. B4 TaxID=3368557 RepID=UPI000DAD8316
MFSKTRPSDSGPHPSETQDEAPVPSPSAELRTSDAPAPPPAIRKQKPAASVLSSDITITGNVQSSGDIQVEGIVEGDIRAQTLIVGESATVKGEIIADEVITHGRVIGRLRGLKVRLSSTARVEGDIVHKAIAIESGAHFEGSVQRQDDPVGQSNPRHQSSSSALASVPAPAQAKAAG